jgi:hypothetical protein
MSYQMYDRKRGESSLFECCRPGQEQTNNRTIEIRTDFMIVPTLRSGSPPRPAGLRHDCLIGRLQDCKTARSTGPERILACICRTICKFTSL